MRWVLPLVLTACGGASALLPSSDAPVEVEVWLEEAAKPTGGVLTVQVVADAALADLALPEPQATGLDFRQRGEARVERIGGRIVVTREYVFTGEKGHYRIPELEVAWSDADGEPQQATSEALWVDLGVEPPREGELADIDEPPRIWTLSPMMAAGVAGLALLLGGGILLAFRRPREEQIAAVPPEPPDVIALRAWSAVRHDPSLDDHAKALAISRIFREYAAAVLDFPAESWTTTEIVEHLVAMSHLPEGNVPRARRLLRATDRVKFADADATAELFDELDADLRAFVESTRPRRWEAA